MKKLLATTLLLAFFLPTSLPGQSQKQPYPVGERPTVNRSERNGTASSAGNIRINGVQVPAYKTTVDDPLEDEGVTNTFEPRSGQQFRTAATAEQLQRLAAFFTSEEWVLVPRGWRLQKGAVGVNGSAVWVFVAPDGNGWLKYTSSGACTGCAQSAASAFFPEARRDAQANDMDFYSRTDVPVQSVRLRPNLIAYQAQKNGRRFDGVVYYQGDEDIPHWQVEVTLPAQQQDLARPILNRFVPPRR